MKRLKIHDELIEFTDKYTSMPIETLIRNQNWGSINFQESKDDLEKAYSILNHFKVLPIEFLDEQATKTILNQATPVGETIDSIKEFTIEQSDPVSQRTSIITQLKTRVNNFYNAAHIWIPFLAYQKGDVQRNIEELTRTVSDAKETVELGKKEIEEKSKEIDDIIVAAREASASVGVAHFTADFMTEVEQLERGAKRWLVASISSAFLTIVAAFVMLFIINGQDQSTFKIVQITTTKLVILAVLLSATVWCSKIYKSNKHLITINKHRANSLKTFQAFMKAAENVQARDAVLLETTRAIFGVTPTGYLDADISSGDLGTRIIEIIKDGSKKITE
jgi:hypothetical protein